jgi:acyl carrier protein
MEELIHKIADILEVDELDVNKKFTDYAEWDSLAGLSLISMLDADYNMTMRTKEILAFNSIKDFCEAIIK